ncbi:MAG: glycosyltransferase family 39 protein [Candidatus Gottesmanbacteria bacterium]
MIKKLLPLILIIILSWWAINSLFHTGFFPMHDDEQIARLYELHQTLINGQFPPRWISNLGFGFGYPFYNFYPPLVYYFGEVFHLIGINLILSTKLVIILGTLLSGIFIYLLAKEFFGRIGGIIAAIFYIYTPYHALDLYVRGALAEFFSGVFIPACLWSTVRLIRTKDIKWLIINSVFLSCLVLSHNLIAIAFIPFYLLWIVFFLFKEQKRKRSTYLLLGSIILAFGLSAYFALPAIIEKKYTLVDTILTGELASYKLHFVYLRQFWNSPWGYGGSIYGLHDGMSFEVGKIHLILAILGGILGFYHIFKKEKTGLQFTFFFILFLLSLFMASFHSDFIWSKIQPLWYLQFPWRFLIFASIFASLLAGRIIDYFMRITRIHRGIKWSLVIIVIVTVIILNKDYFQPARYLEVSDRNYTSKEDLQWRVSKMSFEYVPKGVRTVYSDIGTTQIDITKAELPEKSFKSSAVATIIEIVNKPHFKKYQVSGSGTILTINTYNFPGWEVTLDDQKVDINDNNKFKLITIKVPKGEHMVIAQFNNTPIRTIGNSITLSSIILLILLIIWRKNKKF